MDNTPPGTMLWPDAEETISKRAGAEMNARMSAKYFLRVHHGSGHRISPVLGLLGTATPFLRWGMNLCLTGVAEPALQCWNPTNAHGGLVNVVLVQWSRSNRVAVDGEVLREGFPEGPAL